MFARRRNTNPRQGSRFLVVLKTGNCRYPWSPKRLSLRSNYPSLETKSGHCPRHYRQTQTGVTTVLRSRTISARELLMMFYRNVRLFRFSSFIHTIWRVWLIRWIAVNNVLKQHHRAVYSTQATHHVVQQIERLYWDAINPELNVNHSELFEKGTDFSDSKYGPPLSALRQPNSR